MGKISGWVPDHRSRPRQRPKQLLNRLMREHQARTPKQHQTERRKGQRNFWNPRGWRTRKTKGNCDVVKEEYSKRYGGIVALEQHRANLRIRDLKRAIWNPHGFEIYRLFMSVYLSTSVHQSQKKKKKKMVEKSRIIHCKEKVQWLWLAIFPIYIFLGGAVFTTTQPGYWRAVPS